MGRSQITSRLPDMTIYQTAKIMKGNPMPTLETQIWKSARLTIERAEIDADGTIFRFSGPFTARDIYHSLSPETFRNIFESAPGNPLPSKQIFDLSEVPYMDSLGLGMLVSHNVRCRSKGIPLSITGISPRVQELFRITKMESVLPIASLQTLD
jgi:anti-anti-sigma factor